MFEITVANHIDSAHFLRGYQGKCLNVHGHTWRIKVTLKGERLNELGLLVDFSEVKRIIGEVTECFDHKLINEIEPFDRINPSSENLARYVYCRVKEKIASLQNISVVKVSVSESRDTEAVYYKD